MLRNFLGLLPSINHVFTYRSHQKLHIRKVAPGMMPKSKNLYKGSYTDPKTLHNPFILNVGKMARSEDEHRCQQMLFPCVEVTKAGAGTRLLEFKSQHCSLPAVWVQAGAPSFLYKCGHFPTQGQLYALVLLGPRTCLGSKLRG
jgi:hypothetical protein